MIDNYVLLREYRKCSSKTIVLETALRKNILNFFNENERLKYHAFELLINDDGKYIVLTDYAPHDGEHVPLDILNDFCEEFGVSLETISHELCAEYEKGVNRVRYSHQKIYTILFEIIKK